MTAGTLDALVLVAAGSATALACGLGVLPIAVLGRRVAAYQPALNATAGGLMATASIVGLLMPALEDGAVTPVAAGVAIGVAFLLVTRRALHAHDVAVAGLSGAGVRRSLLVFVVLLAHSLPEGFAMGTAFVSDREGLSLFVILAIGLQNIPEGTAVSIPMHEAGFSLHRQFWAAVTTSLPQPLGALVAFLLVEEVMGLLPLSFGFAAGAMLALVAFDLLPEALRGRSIRQAAFGFVFGSSLMLLLSWGVGV